MKTLSIDEHRIFLLLALILFINGCGSEQSQSEEQVAEPVVAETTVEEQEPTDYTPPEERLSEPAENSTDMYVDVNFNFNTYKVISFDVNAYKEDGAPIGNTLLFVYQIPNDIEALEELNPNDKSLLFITKTNDAGQILIDKEVYQNVQNILLELKHIGIENLSLQKVPLENLVQHQF